MITVPADRVSGSLPGGSPVWMGLVAYLLSLVVVAVLALVPHDARASPTEIPRVSDGEGIKAGQRSVFHTGFAMITGVDTNVFLENRSEGPRAASYIYPSFWLGIGNREIRDGLLMSPAERSARFLDYNLAAIAGFRQYLARRVEVRSQPRFSIGAIAKLSLLPGRKFSIFIDEVFFRGATPGNYEAIGNFFNFNRIENQGRLSFIGRPGGGRISLALGYNSELYQYAVDALRNNNKMVNGLFHETKWRFLPKSSLVFKYDFDWTFYRDCCAEVGRGRNEDSFHHRLLGGYRGQMFRKFTFDVLVGWGFGYYRDDDNGPNFNSFIGNLGMDYYPTLKSRVHLGVYRGFHDSLFGNYYVDNGGEILLSHEFRWRMLGSIGAGVAGRVYHGLPDPGQEADQITQYTGSGADQLQARDTLFSFDAKIEQPFGRIFALGLNYNLKVDSTNFEVGYANGSTDVLGYTKHLVFLLFAVRI